MLSSCECREFEDALGTVAYGDIVVDPVLIDRMDPQVFYILSN